VKTVKTYLKNLPARIKNRLAPHARQKIQSAVTRANAISAGEATGAAAAAAVVAAAARDVLHKDVLEAALCTKVTGSE